MIYNKEEDLMSLNVSTGASPYTDGVTTYVSATEAKEYPVGKSHDKEADEKVVEEAVVYEKDEESSNKATYSINKMSPEERAALVERLKAEQENRQKQLINIVQQMISKQATVYEQADDIWKFLASGEYTVDEETRVQAQADIAEDGYYGVKQTSQRLFDFACALAGDDVEKMKEMQAAVQKGFEMATQAWGRELPEICHETLAATNKLFEEYYASKA